ncbi:hypothetical protein GQ457_03G037200 [Hibiscus cannabinus]
MPLIMTASLKLGFVECLNVLKSPLKGTGAFLPTFNYSIQLLSINLLLQTTNPSPRTILYTFFNDLNLAGSTTEENERATGRWQSRRSRSKHERDEWSGGPDPRNVF